VSSVAKEWKAGRVLRLNTISEVHRAYADRIGVIDTPTFILFDTAGKEQRRWVRDAPALADLP
jgi:DTW domain-containing protein YfiP